MADVSEAIRNYRLWNDALVEVLYPNIEYPIPVYLDLDDEVLAVTAQKVGYEGDPIQGLSDAVKQITLMDNEFSLLRLTHLNRSWQSQIRLIQTASSKSAERPPIPNPPSVAFLALATLAALEMGKDDLISIAYYPRVGDLLGLPREKKLHKNIEIQFHRYSERLWDELNTWLELFEGQKGLPSAYSLSKRYVGIPLSQALVRKADRQKLPIFFSLFNLSPGTDLGSDTISQFLDAWFNSETCSASDSLKKLWNNGSTHDRISEIVSLELAGWDGSLPRGYRHEGNSTAVVRLMAALQSGFLGEKFELSLTYRQTGEEMISGVLQIEGADGSWLPIDFQPLAGNLWRTSNSHGLDISSVLEGSVSIRSSENSSIKAKRLPRTVVPLVRDEIHGGYVEEPVLQLNTNSIVLVRDSEKSLEEVRNVLSQFARPGYEERSFEELPDEWVAFVGVQLFGVPQTRFKELQPIAQNQLTLAGGVRIPSSVRKWSVLSPPEVRVSVAGLREFKLMITDLFTGGTLHEEVSTFGAMVVNLSDFKLGPGDYRASVYFEKTKDPSLSAIVRLRSADEVDSRWNLVEGLAYAVDDGIHATGALTATSKDLVDATAVIDGAFCTGNLGIEPDQSLPLKGEWIRHAEQEIVLQSKVRLAPVSPDSCVYTGRHKMQIETITDRKSSKVQRGECLNCHLVKLYPMWPKAPRHRELGEKVHQESASVKVAELVSVVPENNHNWDAAIDALMHLGGGKGSILNSLAVQIDNDQVFAFNFANVLEQLGYVELQRESDGSVSSWEISPTCIVGTSHGEWQLVGYWAPVLVDALSESLQTEGGTISRVLLENQPTKIVVNGVGEEKLRRLAPEDVYIINSAGSTMLRSLPRMSSLSKALPRVLMPGFNKAERFNVERAIWEDTDLVDRPGAYRLKRDFRSIYIFRSHLDIDNQEAVVATPYLVKYLAAQIESKSLIFYDEENKSLFVPFGVELPGLYARAMVLMSGRRPLDSKITSNEGKRNCHQYFNVDKQDAEMLQTLLLG